MKKLLTALFAEPARRWLGIVEIKTAPGVYRVRDQQGRTVTCTGADEYTPGVSLVQVETASGKSRIVGTGDPGKRIVNTYEV